MKKVIITYFPGSNLLNLHEDNSDTQLLDDQCTGQALAKEISELLFDHLSNIAMVEHERANDENHDFSIKFGGGCIQLSWMTWNPLYGTLMFQHARELFKKECIESLERFAIEHSALVDFCVVEDPVAN